MPNREPKLILSAARKGTGKSYQTEILMQRYVRGSATTPPRRCLILDVNDEYVHIKSIRVSSIPIFSVHPQVEIRRVRPFVENPDGTLGRQMTLDELAETLFVILQSYRNGLLLIEDVNKYISDTMPNDLVGAICTNRHTGVDIILHYQSIGRVTSKVWQNVNLIRLHKCTDAVKRHKHKFEDKYEYLSIAEIIINKKYDDGDKRFFLYVDTDDEKIYGAFTKEDYNWACTKFIQKNYASLINPMLNERDEKGEKIYDVVSAQAEIRKNLLNYLR